MISSLHLLPVSLGEAAIERWLPADARQQASVLKTYIAENAKTARALLIGCADEAAFAGLPAVRLGPLDDDASAALLDRLTETTGDIGLVSEAGCPAVADPGARVVLLAHQLGIQVVPWVGPSSILLGLMASGLDGQRFAFHGYAPVDPAERAKQLRAWEQYSAKHNQTQLLIETPYRNAAMFATLLASLKGDTKLCVARALTTADEWIVTRTIADWKKQPAPQLDKMPTLFLYLAR